VIILFLLNLLFLNKLHYPDWDQLFDNIQSGVVPGKRRKKCLRRSVRIAKKNCRMAKKRQDVAYAEHQ
jgi:hypothetical protein